MSKCFKSLHGGDASVEHVHNKTLIHTLMRCHENIEKLPQTITISTYVLASDRTSIRIMSWVGVCFKWKKCLHSHWCCMQYVVGRRIENGGSTKGKTSCIIYVRRSQERNVESDCMLHAIAYLLMWFQPVKIATVSRKQTLIVIHYCYRSRNTNKST